MVAEEIRDLWRRIAKYQATAVGITYIVARDPSQAGLLDDMLNSEGRYLRKDLEKQLDQLLTGGAAILPALEQALDSISAVENGKHDGEWKTASTAALSIPKSEIHGRTNSMF